MGKFKKEAEERDFDSRNPLHSFFWPSTPKRHLTDNRNLEISYAYWIVRLRWMVIAIIFGLALLNSLLLHYVEPAPMIGIWFSIGLLVVLNIFYTILGQESYFWTNRGLLVQVVVDLGFLTVLLHYSGGIENPMSFSYVFHVILASIMFSRPIALAIVAISTLFVGVLAYGELVGLFHHYTIGAFPHFDGDAGEQHASHDLLYVSIRVGLHFLFMSLSSGFVTALMSRLNRASFEIRNEKIKLNHVIGSTGIGLAIVNSQGEVEALNPNDTVWEPIGGMATDAIWRNWISEELLDSIAQGNEKIYEYERETTDSSGETRHFQLNLSTTVSDNRDGEILATALVAEITERKRLEAEMMHSDRISTLGKVSAGIAHEVGNPLASISTRISLLEDSVSLEDFKSGLVPLKQQVSRINRIVRGVSQIARPQQGKWACFDLRKTIEDTLEVIRLHKGAKNCLLEFKYPDQPMLTNGVEDQIEQVFLNLCINALESMPRGGTFKIVCSNQSKQHTVKFSDSGCGMSDEEQKRIFDLFFTTKKNGLGLGMHIAYQIINAHNGSISLESNPGDGTTFTVTLPKSEFHVPQK
jgi:signal transduction histidine kinase